MKEDELQKPLEQTTNKKEHLQSQIDLLNRDLEASERTTETLEKEEKETLLLSEMKTLTEQVNSLKEQVNSLKEYISNLENEKGLFYCYYFF